MTSRQPSGYLMYLCESETTRYRTSKQVQLGKLLTGQIRYVRACGRMENEEYLCRLTYGM